MSIFSQAINDIFQVDDFLEPLIVNGVTVKVCSYECSVDEKYTEYGVDDGSVVSITCKCSDWSPKRGEQVVFRGRTFRVSNFTCDSHNLTYRVWIKSLTSK